MINIPIFYEPNAGISQEREFHPEKRGVAPEDHVALEYQSSLSLFLL